MEKKLFAVYLWWKNNNWFIEEHDLVFVIAKDISEAKKFAKVKTIIKEDLHCDWIIQLDNVDWYTISILDKWEPEDLKVDNSYQSI